MPKFENTNNALSDLRDSIGEALEESELKKRRTICKRFYVTEEEDRQLEELRQGVSLSAFVRAKVFGSGIPRPRPIVPQINREAYIHLASLRNNCNQIAKAMNTAAKHDQALPLTQVYLDQLERLEELLVEIGLKLSQADDTTREEN
jgi:hypothetical protein